MAVCWQVAKQTALIDQVLAHNLTPTEVFDGCNEIILCRRVLPPVGVDLASERRSALSLAKRLENLGALYCGLQLIIGSSDPDELNVDSLHGREALDTTINCGKGSYQCFQISHSHNGITD